MPLVIGGGSTGDKIPVGTIAMWGKSTAPASWLICNGADVSRATYSVLFAVIGTTFGLGDGVTTFRVPPFYDGLNSRNRTAVGAGDAVGLGELKGDEYTSSGYASVTDSGHEHGMYTGNDLDNSGGNTYVNSNTTNTGYANVSDSGHTHQQAKDFCLGINFIIKYI
jgi:microcystin-dependent protein